MTKRNIISEWPLAVFTLALQIATGLALSVTISGFLKPPANPAILKPLALAVFPIVAASLLVSLMHLGRPLSAWRALSNIHRSRLSLEVALTIAYAAAAFLFSCTWWTNAIALRLWSGVITSVLGLIAVVASAAIYRITARTAWNSGWVMASFVGTTAIATGIAPITYAAPSRIFAAAAIGGSALILLSVGWMWRQLTDSSRQSNSIRIWLATYLLLAIPVPLLLIFSTAPNHAAFAYIAAISGVSLGRMMMYAVAEIEPRF